MVTSIQVSEITRKRLLRYKRQGKKSYDEVIQDLLEDRERIPVSMAGSLPDLPAWNRDTDRDSGRYE